MVQSLAALIIGSIVDFILGDPRELWHPVQGIGWVISRLEKILRRLFPAGRRGERWAGAVLVVLTLLVSVGVPALLLFFLSLVHPLLSFLLSCIFCWQLLAARSLRTESLKVEEALEKEGLEAGRRAVSMIVGRDTRDLTEEGVIKAAVETVAENTSDGVTAPLFYMILAGPLGGFAYKAVNTMDSMVGYKNEKYRYFGTCAARLDDAANFIPARLSALFMTAAAFLAGYDGKNAWRILKRDRKKHKSPNAAHTEAVMAGALDVQLAGDAWYFGKLVRKPFIGDGIRPIERQDIRRACRLEYATALLQLLVLGALKAAVLFML
ncbi:adenosylcobinamide-phosphate synthase CbiB [Lachnoclostridium sp. An118]|uniref:adenosylcobinamide-phosphate synthase CbiB n=1 Tax=Lachnoclostridium sp. An118 TaxID=1965547 RepID=UPI000B38BF67|nr:adenosylcobinamide-phosphate synthase CbiB [Lachnoclostridium sp. An118]OUQ51142.1 cobalamin biosynthesis protein CobD [Lachnoclostridium sp. An118]HJA43054.1 adenosylcobinamide-phosphate synthase CbiB [Candidatus Dorea stercoravium]